MSPTTAGGNAPILDVSSIARTWVKAFRHRTNFRCSLLVFEHLVGSGRILNKHCFDSYGSTITPVRIRNARPVRVLAASGSTTPVSFSKIGQRAPHGISNKVHAFVLVGHGVHRAVVVHADRMFESNIFSRARKSWGREPAYISRRPRSKFHVECSRRP